MIKHLDGIFETVSFEDVYSIQLYLNKEYEHYPNHWHTAFEIIMPVEGNYQAIINSVDYQIKPYDLFIIAPGELHKLVAPENGERWILQFNNTLISNLWGFSANLPLIYRTRIISDEPNKEFHQKLVDLMIAIKEEYLSPHPLKDAAIYANIISMFVLIGRQYMDGGILFPDARHNKQMEYIEKFNVVFEYIDQNFTQDISLESIAKVVGFSKFHFSRLFKQYTNQSFYDYLNHRRVKEAEQLLLNPSLTITDVAIQSGFASISTFNRVFKTLKECTPTEFKYMYRQKNQ